MAATSLLRAVAALQGACVTAASGAAVPTAALDDCDRFQVAVPYEFGSVQGAHRRERELREDLPPHSYHA